MIILVVLLPLILGMIFLSFFDMRKELYLPEKIALSFMVGLGLLTVLMFLLSLMRLPLDRNTIVACSALIAIGGAGFLIRGGRSPFSPADLKIKLKLSVIEWVLLALIALKVLYVFFVALIKPVIDIDAISMYSAGAKAIFYAKTFMTPQIFSMIQDKPLFAYLSQAWVLIGLGDFNDCLIKIFGPIIFLCLLISFYSVLKRSFDNIWPAFFTFLLSTFPFLVFHAATAYVDLPQTAYYALATIYMYAYLKNNDKSGEKYLGLGMALLGLSIWIKRGGIGLAAINLLILLIYSFSHHKKKELKKLFSPLILLFLLSLPWLIYNQALNLLGSVGAVVAGAAAGQPAVAGSASNIEIVFNTLLRKIFLYADWHLLFVLFLAAVILCFKKAFRPPLLYLLAIIILDLTAIFANFSFTSTFQWILDGTLLDRLVMNSVPVILYFCAEAFIPFLQDKDAP